MNVIGPPDPWVEAWLSPARYGVYVAVAGGDRRLALELYEWNAVISAAFHRDLARPGSTRHRIATGSTVGMPSPNGS